MVIGIDIRCLGGKKLTGVGIYTFSIIKNILISDNINEYKLFYNSLTPLESKIRKELVQYPNVKLINKGIPNKLFNLALILKLIKLDRVVKGVDYFWFPNLNFWSVSNKCKTIITIHDLSYKILPWAYSYKMRLWHLLVSPKKKLNKADRIIAVSENTKNDLIKIYNLDDSKIIVIYPGIELEHQGFKIEDLGLPKKYILYLGTLEPRKNVESIIQAFEEIKDPYLHLVIAGGKGWLYRRIIKSINKSSKKEQIFLLDYIHPDERWNLYQKAKMLIWPSYYEGFGFPPLEAMSQGCPVITSANSSLPEVIGNSALLINPYNISEIISFFIRLLTDNELREDLITIGKEKIKKFSWQNTALEILKLFKYENRD